MMLAPPSIDLTRLDEADPVALDELQRACTHTGFFVIAGHGLESELGRVFERARAFFDLDPATKEQVPRVDRYGYVPHAPNAIDTDRASDRTEYLDMGLAGDVGSLDRAPLPSLDGFEPAVRAYQDGALAIGRTILRALALSLGVDGGHFVDRMTRPQCRLRFLHYPPVEATADGNLPVTTDPHTDYGLITLLATDGVPGLEVKPIGGDWGPVPARWGDLVINLGDMMARWTNDRYRSTPHRVVGPAVGDRISIPFFVNPDPGVVVETIPACVSADRPDRYQPVTAGDFLAQRIDSSHEPYVDPSEGPARPARRQQGAPQ